MLIKVIIEKIFDKFILVIKFMKNFVIWVQYINSKELFLKV